MIMLRKCAAYLTIVLMISCLFTGCAAGKAALPPKPSSVDINDFEQLSQVYLDDVFHSLVTADTWELPKEVNPDNLVNYYLIQLQKADLLRDGGEPAEEVEAAVQKHFDVSVEHLRRSSYYQADSNKYDFAGWGGGAGATITGATQEGNLLTIAFDVIGGDKDKLLWSGEVNIDTSTADYKYVSCREWDYQ